MSGQAAPAPTYAHLKEIVDNLRAELMAQRDPNAFEHKELVIPSSVDKDREIAVHIYEPENVKEGEKGPVVITLHGSGFIIPSLGENAAWCSRTARRLGIRVVDSDYAKAPEHPFPACWQDAADVIRWTLGQPWCSGSVALTGWSAGGSLTIGFCAPNIAKKYGLSQQETDAIKGGISFYPPMGAENDARVAGKNAKSNEWLQENGIPGIGFTMRMLDFFNACYMLKTDPSEIPKLPELTPILQSSPASVWTKPLTIVTAEYDTLRDEAEQFVQNLQADGHPDVVVYTAKETSHGWETRITLNEEQWTASTKGGLATKEAYNLVETRLKKVLGL